MSTIKFVASSTIIHQHIMLKSKHTATLMSAMLLCALVLAE